MPSDLFMVLDPEGVLVRIVESKAEFDRVSVEHAFDRIYDELSREKNRATRNRVGFDIMLSIAKYQMVRIGGH